MRTSSNHVNTAEGFSRRELLARATGLPIAISLLNRFQTGQITQNARGTGGGATTVNFNINTLDASGFDEMLIRNRGTITQIINNAVNERGKGSII